MATNVLAPKLSRIKPELYAVLIAMPTLVAAALKASPDPVTRTRCVVVDDNGTRKRRIDDLLRESGVAVVVEPVIKWTTRDQSGKGWVADTEVSVSVRINPTRNAEEGERGGANVDVLALCVEIVDAVVRRDRHPGAEYFQHKGGALTTFNEGELTYDLIFTKEIQQ